MVARRIYRTKAGGSEYFYVDQLSDNTTTTYTDNVPDANLTQHPPLVNTAGGQTVYVSSISAGPSGTIARKIYRTKNGGTSYFYLDSLDDNTTTTYTDNKPDDQLGALLPTTNTTAGTAETLDTLTGIPPSGTGSIRFAIPKGEQVNILITRNSTTAQTALAALVGGDGIHEHYIQDNRLARNRVHCQRRRRARRVQGSDRHGHVHDARSERHGREGHHVRARGADEPLGHVQDPGRDDQPGRAAPRRAPAPHGHGQLAAVQPGRLSPATARRGGVGGVMLHGTHNPSLAVTSDGRAWCGYGSGVARICRVAGSKLMNEQTIDAADAGRPSLVRPDVWTYVRDTGERFELTLAELDGQPTAARRRAVWRQASRSTRETGIGSRINRRC